MHHVQARLGLSPVHPSSLFHPSLHKHTFASCLRRGQRDLGFYDLPEKRKDNPGRFLGQSHSSLLVDDRQWYREVAARMESFMNKSPFHHLHHYHAISRLASAASTDKISPGSFFARGDVLASRSVFITHLHHPHPEHHRQPSPERDTPGLEDACQHYWMELRAALQTDPSLRFIPASQALRRNNPDSTFKRRRHPREYKEDTMPEPKGGPHEDEGSRQEEGDEDMNQDPRDLQT
jgi:hypothetical protein